jgi:putative transposase
MPRTGRRWIDGLAYHLLNRGNRKQRIFSEPGDYEAFLTTLGDALDRVPVGLLSFSVMPNHFHLVVWPQDASSISAFMRWFMNAHIRRHHEFHALRGSGHLYQGRFKAFPIQTGEHLLTVQRYVEANALRAALVQKAEAWPWCSLSRTKTIDRRPLLSEGPTPRPPNWVGIVNESMPLAIQEAVRAAAQRQLAFGDPSWVRAIEKAKGGHSSLSVPLSQVVTATANLE